ncbi:MAG: MBL fold metallo-hydrolase [Blastochloris sp.]|nr:MBL fold metallo-hydrolase [Blastochloris sp.]
MTTHTDSVELVPNNGWDSRILVCRCGTLVDTFIVVTAHYVVLIDTMINKATASALLAIAAPHLAGRQLLVINTHADWDHAWGNHMFTSPNGTFPAPIIAAQQCAMRFRNPAMREKLVSMREGAPGRFDDVQLTPPTLLFDQQFTIDGGDLTLELFATPGHKADHIAIYLPEIRTLLAGDAAELPFPFVESAASLPLLRDSLARMVALEPTYALYCHAPVTSGPAVLAQNIAYFDLIEQRCRTALTNGISLTLVDDTNVEDLVKFPYEEAIPTDMDANALADFYRSGHRGALRTMLEYLSNSG